MFFRFSEALRFSAPRELFCYLGSAGSLFKTRNDGNFLVSVCLKDVRVCTMRARTSSAFLFPLGGALYRVMNRG